MNVKNLTNAPLLIPAMPEEGQRPHFIRVDPQVTRTDVQFDPEHPVVAAWEKGHAIEVTGERPPTKAQRAAAAREAAETQKGDGKAPKKPAGGEQT